MRGGANLATRGWFELLRNPGRGARAAPPARGGRSVAGRVEVLGDGRVAVGEVEGVLLLRLHDHLHVPHRRAPDVGDQAVVAGRHVAELVHATDLELPAETHVARL